MGQFGRYGTSMVGGGLAKSRFPPSGPKASAVNRDYVEGGRLLVASVDLRALPADFPTHGHESGIRLTDKTCERFIG